jgi:hypothetical protein
MGPVRLGKILEKVIISSGLDKETRDRLRQGLKENKIFAVWEDSVGQTVASHSQPEKIQSGYLTVIVSDSAWMQELQFLKSEIKKKLNQKLGRGTVRDIRFQLGTISAMKNSDRDSAAEQKEAAGRLSVIDSRTLAGIDEQVRDIKDPGVRESVRRYLIASSTSSVERKTKRE